MRTAKLIRTSPRETKLKERDRPALTNPATAQPGIDDAPTIVKRTVSPESGTALGRLALLTALGSATLWIALGGEIGVAYWVTAAVSTIMALVAVTRTRQDIFHPWAFPQAYWVYALISPWFFMVITGRDLRIIPVSTIDSLGAKVIVLSAIAWLCGTLVGGGSSNSLSQIAATTQRPQESNASQGWRYSHFRSMRTFGVAIFLTTLALKAVQLYVGRGRTYGQDQTSIDAFTTLTPVVEGLFTASVLLLALTAGPLSKKLVPPWLFVGLAAYAGSSLLILGSRAELIAPAVLLVWFATRTRRINIAKVAALALAVMLLFNWIGDRRVDGPAVAGMEGASFFERSLVDTSSPFLVTTLLADVVPQNAAYSGGNTYFEAGKYLLPGYLSRAMFGPPEETASLKFRELIGVTNSNSGLGFSLPSEAYLNFGQTGAFVIPFVLASLFAKMYRFTGATTRRLRATVYPIALAMLPYGLRADSLGQMKMLLYPLIIVAISTLFANRRAGNAE